MRRAIALATLLALSGCGTLETHHRALGPPHAPTTGVQILDAIPTRPYTEGGFVQAFGYGAAADGDIVLHALVKEAETIGCDAVARVRLDAAAGVVHGVGVCLRWWVELPPSQPAATKGGE